MSAKTETIRIRISPGVRTWQALLMGAALVGTLLVGLLLGRGGTPANAGSIDTRNFASYACTSHVPTRACDPAVAKANGQTAHVPAGGPEAYGG